MSNITDEDSAFLEGSNRKMSAEKQQLDVGQPSHEDNKLPSSERIDIASEKAFSSSASYLQSELSATGNELRLLEKLNDASIAKYEAISRQTQDMVANASKVKQTYKEMEMQIAEVDDLVKSIDTLEQVAHELDNYTIQLEAKFRKLLKH